MQTQSVAACLASSGQGRLQRGGATGGAKILASLTGAAGARAHQRTPCIEVG